jgi:hypothetical protein
MLNYQYVRDRAKVFLYMWRNPEQPWLAAPAISFIEKWIKATDIGLEFGSGRSTFWLAKRVKFLNSFEHDPDWAAKIELGLRGMAIKNVSLKLLDTGEYAIAAKSFPDENFDIVLIDGKKRDFVASGCMPKLKKGGILLIDNAERYFPKKFIRERAFDGKSSTSWSGREDWASPLWKEVGEIIESWRSFCFSNGIWDTAIFVKPPS